MKSNAYLFYSVRRKPSQIEGKWVQFKTVPVKIFFRIYYENRI